MYKKSITLFLLKLLKIPLSILILSLTAKNFGVSLDNDVWLLSSTIIGIIGLAVWGPINEIFRAKFVAIKEINGEKIAIKYTKSLIFYMFIISMLLTTGIFIYPDLVAKIIAPGFDDISYQKLLRMISALAPILLFTQISLILSSVLNAFEVYYIPEIASLISQVVNIFIIIFFAPTLGIKTLVIALYVSVIILCIFLIQKIVRLGIPLFNTPIVFKFDGFKLFFVYSIPFFIPYLIGQLSGIFEKSIATSIGVGAVSTIDFARRIPDLLNAIIVSIVLTILVPTLTKVFINKDAETYNLEFLTSYRLGLFFLSIFIVFFINAAEPLSYFLYKSDSINTQQMNNIVLLSKLFSFSLIGVFSYIIFGMSMLSSNKAKLYVISGSVAQILSIIFNFLMVHWFEMSVFPLTFFFVHLIAAIYMFSNYPFGKKDICKETIRYYGLCILSTICSCFIYSLYDFSFGDDILMNLLVDIIYSLFLAFILIGFFGFFLKVPEISLLKKIIFSTLKKDIGR